MKRLIVFLALAVLVMPMSSAHWFGLFHQHPHYTVPAMADPSTCIGDSTLNMTQAICDIICRDQCSGVFGIHNCLYSGSPVGDCCTYAVCGVELLVSNDEATSSDEAMCSTVPVPENIIYHDETEAHTH